MKHPVKARLLPLAALAALVLPVGCDDGSNLMETSTIDQDFLAAEAPGGSNAATPLRLMTRNMYLGGDIAIILEADFNNPLSVVQATNVVWAQVQATRIHERAVALVDEIQAGAPLIVGIQEIPLFVILDGGFQPTGFQDHLAILMAEIHARGLPYEVAAVQENITATLPLTVDLSTFAVTEWIRFIDRIALLVRSDLPVIDVDQGNYQAAYSLAPGIDIQRGWIRVTAELGGIPYHFVNTHLEVQRFAPVQLAQTQELLQRILAGLDGITVLLGDLNSDAEAGPGAPSWTPTYGLLMDAGFQDTWRTAQPGRPFRGYTCCQAADLANPVSELDERIDFVLLRAAQGPPGLNRFPGAVSAEIVGEEMGDLTSPSGLWPSDHAGLLVELRIPQAPLLR